MKGIWTRLLLAALSLLLPLAQASAEEQAAEGFWALQVEGRVLALLDLHRDSNAVGGWAGAWIRPEHISIDQSRAAFDINGPTVRRPIGNVTVHDDRLDLAVQGTVPGGEPDVFTFQLVAADAAAFGLKDAPIEPIGLVRVAAGTAVASGWDSTRRYALPVPLWPSNPEMTALFEADQADRLTGRSVDWSVVGPRDRAREARTLALLNAGALRSGEDFRNAAFIFQHGDEPGDYLIAHTLAVIAAARGRPDATWIAAATLDRYLQNVEQSQIYGTQFMTRPGQPTTQEPYDRQLVPDALRRALGVPPQAEQEVQRTEMEARYRAREAEQRETGTRR